MGGMGSGSDRRAHRLPDVDFRRLVEDALARHNLSDVIGRSGFALKKSGREFRACCPFHQEKTPSFYVNDDKGFFHCFGCGSNGDALAWLTRQCGMNFRDAYEALKGDRFPSISEDMARERREANERERREAIAEVRGFWKRTDRPEGTIAERYLRDTRGITAPLPPSIRFGWLPLSRDDAGNWREPMPAVVGAVTCHGELVGIQRIYLRNDGSDKRWAKPRKSKFSKGAVKGGALRLDHGLTGNEIVITEGPEDGLTLMQEMPGRRVWVALGTDMMPAIEFPDDVDSIIIAGQNDKAGKAAVARAGEALLARGYAVRETYPAPEFKDWNDQLRGVAQ